MEPIKCQLKKQGLAPGSCLVKVDGKRRPACQVTLKYEKGEPSRLITSIHLSRPENYLSIYQSGCNFSCRKCHSWSFSKVWNGSWYTPEDILKESMQYEKLVNLEEPREKATAWHAQETCRCCGTCVTSGWRSSTCPDILDREAILVSPQGFGPARNIVAFTGGDVTCCPEFYEECARLILEERIDAYRRLAHQVLSHYVRRQRYELPCITFSALHLWLSADTVNPLISAGR